MSTQNSNMALGVDSVRWNLRFLYENAGPALEADMARCREAYYEIGRASCRERV